MLVATAKFLWRHIFVKNKNFKTKKIAITAMAVICAFSSATAITAGAKTSQYKHTVCVGGYSGGNDATWLSIKKNDTYTNDYFPSYPEIFDKKSYSKIKSRAESKDGKTVTAYKNTTLQKNSPATYTVSYGKLKKGSWLLNYRYCSGGGCRSQVTTMERY